MPTEEQLLKLESIGGLSDKERNAIDGLRAKGGFPAPLTKKESTPTEAPDSANETFTNTLMGGAKALAGETFYKTIVRPGADVNRFGYSMVGEKGGVFEEPEKYKERRVKAGLYGAGRLTTETPHGWLEHLGAAASPLEGALLTTPPGRAIFGLGTVIGAATQDDQIVDAVEGVGGLTMLGRDLFRAGKLLRRKLQWPFSTAEKAYVASKGELKGAETTAAKAQEAADAVEAHVADARGKADVVATAAEDAAQSRVDKAESEYKAALDHVGQLEEGNVVPTRELKDRLQLSSGGPTAEAAGKMLQAVDEDIYALSPDYKHPVGASAKAIKLSEQTERFRTGFANLGDKKGVKLPVDGKGSGSMSVLRRRATQYLKSLVQGQGTISEKAIAKQISMLGASGLRDLGTGEIFRVSTPAKFAELRRLNPRLQAVYEDLPLSKLVDVYSKAREIGMSPREFPVSSRAAGKRFSQMTNALRTTIGALAGADPELNQAWLEWQRHVRRVEQPFIKETAAKLLAPGVTPRKAFETLLADDPTALERYFTHSKGAERLAISEAAIKEVVLDASKGEEITDFGALAKRWKKLPKESQDLLGSWGNGAAKLVMDEASVRLKQLEEGKEVAKTVRGGLGETRRELAKTRAMKRKWNEGLESYHRTILDSSSKEIQLTADALAKAQAKAERLGGLHVFTPEALVKAAQEGPVLGFHPKGSFRMFMKAHAVMGLVDILHGNVIRAIIQGGEAMMFRRNKLVREALETPINTPRGRELALALYLAFKPHLGPSVAEPDKPQPNGEDTEFRSRE